MSLAWPLRKRWLVLAAAFVWLLLLSPGFAQDSSPVTGVSGTGSSGLNTVVSSPATMTPVSPVAPVPVPEVPAPAAAAVPVAQPETASVTPPSTVPAAAPSAEAPMSVTPASAPLVPALAVAAPTTEPGSGAAMVAQTPAAGAVSATDAATVGTASAAAGAVDAAKDPKAEAEKNNLLNHKRLNVAAIILILLVLVSYYTYKAGSGKELFIRRISGLAAIDDAVGRATEMGRGVLFIPGIMDMDDIQTIAGVTILGHVAKKTAEYDTPLLAPMTRAFVMSVAQEVVYQSYVEKGRKDAYRADRINYLTDDQFGYVAGVGGIVMREKPAACFYLGTFYAESLILAETGNSVGAIQIAGTAEPSQIPFFVAACDYTLIGEELFAASAYLSRNPKEVGALKGQDASKVMIIIMIIIGVLLVTVSKNQPGDTTTMKSMAGYYLDLLKTE